MVTANRYQSLHADFPLPWRNYEREEFFPGPYVVCNPVGHCRCPQLPLSSWPFTPDFESQMGFHEIEISLEEAEVGIEETFFFAEIEGLPDKP